MEQAATNLKRARTEPDGTISHLGQAAAKKGMREMERQRMATSAPTLSPAQVAAQVAELVAAQVAALVRPPPATIQSKPDSEVAQLKELVSRLEEQKRDAAAEQIKREKKESDDRTSKLEKELIEARKPQVAQVDPAMQFLIEQEKERRKEVGKMYILTYSLLISYLLTTYLYLLK